MTSTKLGHTVAKSLLVCIIAAIVGSCAEPPAPYIAAISAETANTRSAQRVAELSKSIPDQESFDIFTDILPVSQDKAFAAAIAVLKNEGDPIAQADSDVGYIVTAKGTHGFVTSHYFTQYVIVFEPISKTQTRITLKLYQWRIADNGVDYAVTWLAPMSEDTVQKDAGRFVDKVRKRANVASP